MPRTADHLLFPTGPQPMGPLGRVVVAHRRRLGISQETLAGRAGLSRKYLSDVEGGKRNLTLLGLYRIGIGLETTTDALLAEANAILAEEAPWLTEAVRRGRVDP